MPSLHLSFINNSGQETANVAIGFVPGSSGDTFTITNSKDRSALLPLNHGAAYPFAGNWYSLKQLSAGVDIASFSGRVYVAFGPPWQVTGAGYEPAQAVTDPNLFLRYDKFEMTFTGSAADVANLTSIDYWSIPMTLQTSFNGQIVGTVRGLFGSATAQGVFDALNTLTIPPVSGLPGHGGVDGAPLPALVPGLFAQYPKGPKPGTDFARIIGPSSYPPSNPPPGAIPVTPYDTWQATLQNLVALFGPGTGVGAVVPTLGNGVVATIAGEFAGVGPNVPTSGPQSRQSYNLTATIDASNDITLTGTLSGISGTTTMLYKAADLMNPAGIYGGNTPYYLNGSSQPTSPGNDVYGWVGGDLFSGLNIGAVGSQLIVQAGGASTMVGALQSQSWFQLPPSQFFAAMQPKGFFYNRWAATLAPLSQAYNFAYSDRFAPVFVSLNPATVDTLTLTLESAAVQQGTFFTVQSTTAWQDTGVIVAGGKPAKITYAQGLWTSNPRDNGGELFDAAGNPDFVANQTGYTMVGQNEGALIGAVGTNPVFCVGNGPTTTPNGQTGTLRLCINDDLKGRYGSGLKDNRGSVTVFIQVG